jgi:hypothetical protein
LSSRLSIQRTRASSHPSWAVQLWSSPIDPTSRRRPTQVWDDRQPVCRHSWRHSRPRPAPTAARAMAARATAGDRLDRLRPRLRVSPHPLLRREGPNHRTMHSPAASTTWACRHAVWRVQMEACLRDCRHRPGGEVLLANSQRDDRRCRRRHWAAAIRLHFRYRRWRAAIRLHFRYHRWRAAIRLRFRYRR